MPNFIISGGPGAGKTTLLNALQTAGYYTVDEASRVLIQEQVAQQSQCLPWVDLPCFARLVLHRMTTDYERVSTQPDHVATFFDRVTPDRVTPDRVTPDRVTPDRVTPDRVTPDRVTPDRVTPDRVTPDQVTFFDRGIPDIIAYLRVAGLPVDDVFYQAVRQYPYQPVVLMAPPWEAIYINDTERWQTFAEATALHDSLVDTYQSLGYDVVPLPQTTVAGRVAFVQQTLLSYRVL